MEWIERICYFVAIIIMAGVLATIEIPAKPTESITLTPEYITFKIEKATIYTTGKKFILQSSTVKVEKEGEVK